MPIGRSVRARISSCLPDTCSDTMAPAEARCLASSNSSRSFCVCAQKKTSLLEVVTVLLIGILSDTDWCGAHSTTRSARSRRRKLPLLVWKRRRSGISWSENTTRPPEVLTFSAASRSSAPSWRSLSTERNNAWSAWRSAMVDRRGRVRNGGDGDEEEEREQQQEERTTTGGSEAGEGWRATPEGRRGQHSPDRRDYREQQWYRRRLAGPDGAEGGEARGGRTRETRLRRRATRGSSRRPGTSDGGCCCGWSCGSGGEGEGGDGRGRNEDETRTETAGVRAARERRRAVAVTSLGAWSYASVDVSVVVGCGW